MPRIRNVDGVRPLSFFIRARSFKVVTTGNGTGTKNVLKWNRALGFEFNILCLRRYYCSESKPILCLDTVYCKFLLYVSVEIDPFSCEQTSAI